MRVSIITKVLLSAGFAALVPLSLPAQEVTGSIRGTVYDPGGAIVSSASVRVVNSDTGVEVRHVTSNDRGQYVAPLLPVARYQLIVEAAGFKKDTESGIVLNVGDRLTEDIHLQVGSQNESVQVTADAFQVQLQNASAEGLISGEQVRGLPINNRNYEQLVLLQPGVSGNVPDQLYVGVYNYQNQTNVTSFSVSGGRDTQNNWTIDGADNVDRGSNRTLLNYPSVEAISEFKILRGNYNAEYGRGASGQVTVVTRSGTRQFHGDVYEFFRNDVLNANTYLNNQNGVRRQPLRYNDFGGTIGGPVEIPFLYKPQNPKTFFFFSEEMRRIHTPTELAAVAPTAALKQGKFTVPVCNGFDAAGNCTSTGSSVTISPAAQAYLNNIWNKIPDASSDYTLNSNVPAVFNYQEEMYRVDHNVNDKVTLTGRFLNDKIPTVEPGGLFTNGSLPGVSTTATNAPGKNWLGRVTVAITPALYNETGYAYSYGAIVSNPTGLMNIANSPDAAAAVTLPYKSTLVRVPSIDFQDFSGLDGFGQYRNFNSNHNFFDNLSWVRGSHSLKFGISYDNYEKRENAAGNNTGSFYFDATGKPKGGDDFQQEWANFLQGFASNFTQDSKDYTADINDNSYEFYAQDEWRPTPRLTISYGFRYSLFLPPTDGHNSLTNFDPRAYNPAAVIKLDASGMRIPGSGDPTSGIIIGNAGSRFGGGVNAADYTGIAPRIGLAYDPFGDGKTSIRAGFGIFVEPLIAGLWEYAVFNNPPFVFPANINYTSLAQPASGAAQVDNTPPFLRGFATNWRNSYTEQWDLDVQHELGHNFVLDIGYFAQRGVHLIGQIDINQLRAGQAIAAGIQQPGQPLSRADTNLINPLRPYPGYGAISIVSPQFGSSYNSLQSQLQKRFGSAGTAVINYTYGHALTDNQAAFGTQTQYTYNPRLDYGPTQLDRRHVVTADYVYPLPFYLSQQGLSGHLLGGWNISGIVNAETGLPLTIFQSDSIGDPGGIGTLAGGGSDNRPNLLFSPQKGAPRTLQRWFNPAAFAPNVSTGQPGNEPRGSIRGPGWWRYDMALEKNTKLGERVNTQFRVESFNLFNHTNPSGLYTTSISEEFDPADPGTWGLRGKVRTFRDPRLLQVALKLEF